MFLKQHIRILSEGSYEVIAATIQLYHHKNKLHFKYIHIKMILFSNKSLENKQNMVATSKIYIPYTVVTADLIFG